MNSEIIITTLTSSCYLLCHHIGGGYEKDQSESSVDISTTLLLAVHKSDCAINSSGRVVLLGEFEKKNECSDKIIETH
jgi:hypothetical protein